MIAFSNHLSFLGLATLPGSALRAMVDVTKVVEVAMEEEVPVTIMND